MINRVVLVGRLTRDPDLKSTGSGVSVATFSLAVNRQFTNNQGEREADFINCVLWRKGAEIFSQYTHKGSLVGVEGRLQTRSYEKDNGERVYVTEVVVDNFSFLESKNQQGHQNNQNQSQQFGDAPVMNSDPFADTGNTIDIKDDDLPF